MRIAIIGAGFCGLATAWHLTQYHSAQIVLLDSQGIGKGASGVAAGLLHPYVGTHSKRNWRAAEGMAATLDLLHVAEKALGCPVANRQGILRPATTPQQMADFEACSTLNPDDVEWRTAQENQAVFPQLLPYPGIFIKSGVAVDCEKYLQGLWMACQGRGLIFEKRSIGSLAELDNFDRIVVAMGASSNSLPELARIPLRGIKGQILELALPPNMNSFPFPFNSQVYLLMSNQNTCIAGATFERDFVDATPNLDAAKRQILPKLQAFIEGFENPQILTCRAGIRAVASDRRPFMRQVSSRCWVLSGMGSKGLLYYALMAKELATKI